MYSLKSHDPSTSVLATNNAPPLEVGNSIKVDVVWTLKHEISSPKLYKLAMKTELKGDTAQDIKNFYKHISMCINMVTRLQ